MIHPVGLMRASNPGISMELCLASEIDPVVGAFGVEFVPQIRAHVRVVAFRLPGTMADLSTDRGSVTSESSGDLGLRDTAIDEFLDLDSVVKGEVAVMCGQGSAALRW